MSNNSHVGDVPPIEEAKSFTDWVIRAGAETDIDTYTLWQIGRAAADVEDENPTKFDVDPAKLDQELKRAMEQDGEYKPEPEESDSQPEPEESDSQPEPES